MKYLSAILVMLLLSVAMVGAQEEWTAEEVVAVLEVMMEDPQFRAELVNLIVAHWPASEGAVPVISAGADIQALFDSRDEAGLVRLVVSDDPNCFSYILYGMAERNSIAIQMLWRQRFINHCT